MKYTHLHKALIITIHIILLLNISQGANLQGYTPEYNEKAIQLRREAPKNYEFSRAVLGDVLRFLALDADISFFAMPDGSEGIDKLVTFKIRTSPFQALETLAKANGLVLVYDKGIWYIRPSNDNELIGRVYLIKYNTGEGGEGSKIGSAESKIVKDIKTLLGMDDDSVNANIVKEVASVGNFSELPYSNAFADKEAIDSQIVDKPNKTSKKGSQIIWNSETNTLTVVATRQQHQWIEAYLTTVDKPQKMIAIEAKFFETGRNPSSSFGLEWGSSSFSNETTNLRANKFGANGLNIGLSSIMSSNPLATVLSSKQVNLAINAILSDDNTVTVSYPRVITRNNKKVSIKSNLQIPVVTSQTDVNASTASSSSTANVQMISIGTNLDVTPKIMFNGDVLMDLKITHKELAGEKNVGGDVHPIIDSRDYQSPVQVRSGFTIAIAGLDRAQITESSSGVPIISEIPFFGNLFKTENHTDTKKHMMMFITPTIIEETSFAKGVSERPVSLVHNKIEMQLPNFNSDGTVNDTPYDRDYIIQFYNNELKNLNHIVKVERMGNEESYRELNFIIRSTETMLNKYEHILGTENQRLQYDDQKNKNRQNVNEIKSGNNTLRNQMSALEDIRYRALQLLYTLETYLKPSY